MGLPDIAKHLGVDYQFLKVLAERGEFPAIIIGNSEQYKASLAMVLAWQRRLGDIAAEQSGGQVKAKRRQQRKRAA
jgi:uncharacterized protein YeaC (DUF1315 family)